MSSYERKESKQKMVNVDVLRKAFCLETPWEEVFEEAKKTDSILKMSGKDLLTLLQNLQKKDWTPKELYEKWSHPAEDLMRVCTYDIAPETIDMGRTMIYTITGCADVLKERDDLHGYIDYALMIQDLEQTLEGTPKGRRKKKTHELWYTDLSKLENIEELDDEKFQALLKPGEVREMKKIVEDLISRNYPEAIYIKAYGSYVGDRLYPNNWKLSRDLLLRLMDHPDVTDEEKCDYANMLGYIYYYGRTNRGIPQYKKAAEYFTMGALAGIHESMYKLADQYIAGKGVPKNEEIAVRLIVQVYRESRDEFLSGDHLCKFADAALRMGYLYRDGIGVYPSQETALYYYLIADLAIRMRMEEYDYVGDTTVASAIRSELNKIRGDAPEKKHPKQMITETPFMMLEAIKDGRLAEFEVERTKKGIRLTGTRVPSFPEHHAPSMLMVLPEWEYCKLVDEVVQYAYDVNVFEMERSDAAAFRANRIDLIKGDEGQTYFVFFRDDEWVATLQADRFVTDLD